MLGRRERSEGRAGPRFALPPDVRAYAIGDVHGQLALLERLRDAIAEDINQFPIGHSVEIFLGDYVDRGPDSRGVVDYLVGVSQDDHTVSSEQVFLRGNHETYVTDFLSDPSMLPSWVGNGGASTLASYDVAVNTSSPDPLSTYVEFSERLPREHRTFLENLHDGYKIGEVLFVHAGIRPNVAIDKQRIEDLLLIRQEFLEARKLPVRVVHGHTPVREPEVTPYRINVDTAAFATGRLTCAVLEGAEVRFLSTGG